MHEGGCPWLTPQFFVASQAGAAAQNIYFNKGDLGQYFDHTLPELEWHKNFMLPGISHILSPCLGLE